MFQKLLKKISAALDKQHVPYMVIGGQAVLLYGEPRLTKDIDITLGIGIDGLDKIKRIVNSLHFEYLADHVDEFVKETMVLPVVDAPSGIRIDFIFSYSPYERQAIERARGIKFGKTNVKFAALEDVVIHKIIAARARDIEDVRCILLKNPDCDSRYIEKWLAEFDASLGKNCRASFLALKKT